MPSQADNDRFVEVVGAMTARRSADTPFIQRMIAVREKYNGDQVLSLPDVKGEPAFVPPTAQIVHDAIEFLAMRAASTRPYIDAPALDITSDRSQKRAATRRRAWCATWYENGLTEIGLRRAYRHFFGYGTWAMQAMPDPDIGVRVELRDPLTTYPEARTPEDHHSPLNVGYVYGRSTAWIAKKYPEAAAMVRRSMSDEKIWDLCEWVDEDRVMIGILGPRFQEAQFSRSDSGWQRAYNGNSMLLRAWPNRAGMVPCAIPRRVTLDRVVGLAYAAVGMQNSLERFTALELTAAEKYVFPDMVVVGRDGRTPMLVGGQWRDGRTGEANFIQDGDVKLLQAAPGPLTMPTIDRIQENAMKTAGLVPQASGQTYGALRTGRAIDALGGFSTDPRIQEAQEVSQRSLVTLNEGIAAVYKGYFPGRKFTFFSGWPGDPGLVEFVPEKDFETTKNVVTYAVPGADATEITVGLGQLVSLRLMDRGSARRKHPWIDNPEAVETSITMEMLEDAVLQNFLAQGQQGAVPLIDQSRVIQLVRAGARIEDAIQTADDEARQRQVAQAPAPEPGQVMAPEQAPGLALPGQGAESLDQTTPTQGPPPQATQNAAQLFRALRAGVTRG